MRYLLTLEYDGTPFCGWQRQRGCRSVQAALEEALTPLCGHPVTVTGAGRTDAGVHALGQAAHFDTTTPRPPETLRKALNATTPATLAVLTVRPVSPQLHARYSAHYREYLYRLHDRPAAPALERERVWHQRHPLDHHAMAAAAHCLLGEHDFSAFRAASCQAKSPIKRLTRVELERRGDEVWLWLGGNAFLHHMVRNVVGSLVMVGRGTWPPQRLAQLLAGCDRRQAAATAPPQGLYLTRVAYPDPLLAPPPAPEA